MPRVLLVGSLRIRFLLHASERRADEQARNTRKLIDQHEGLLKMDMENIEVQTEVSQDPAAKPKAALKTLPAEKHSPRQVDKYAERRAALKKQKRTAHRHKIASSNTNG